MGAADDDARFEDGVLAAVNLGDDADTTAAIFGQLAGAIYGRRRHPRALARARCTAGDEILALADALYDLDASRPAIARFAHRPPAAAWSQCATPEEVAGGARAGAAAGAARGAQRRALLRRALDARPGC